MRDLSPGSAKRRAHGLRLVVVLASLALAACFDIEHKVAIQSDGSGQIEIALITDDVLPDDTSFDTILKSPDERTTVREYSEDGRFIHEEILTFDSLDDVRLQDDSMVLSVRERTLWGVGPTRATFTRTMKPVAVADDDFGLLQRVLADRTYTFTLTVPGLIEDVPPVMLRGLEATPERDGNTITWRIPMGALTRVDEVTFEVKFITFGEVVPGASGRAEGSVSGLLQTDR